MKDKNMINNKYQTRDIGAASAFLSDGLQFLTLRRDDNIYWFVFDDPKNIGEKLHNDYTFGEYLVNAKDFYTNLRELKRKIFN